MRNLGNREDLMIHRLSVKLIELRTVKARLLHLGGNCKCVLYLVFCTLICTRRGFHAFFRFLKLVACAN